MTDEVRQLLKDLLMLIAGGGITFFIQHWRSRRDQQEQLRKAERDHRVTWVYMIQLVEGYKDTNVIPPDPPEALQTDPELMRILKAIKEDRNKHTDEPLQ